jgi:hypothetical protein
MPHEIAALNPEFVRTVDSLQRIYAFVVSVAIGESLRKLFSPIQTSNSDAKDELGQEHHLNFWKYWPEAIAFYVTIIPFFQAMNRYVDATFMYSPVHLPNDYLYFTFLILFVECCTLFVTATTLVVGKAIPFNALAVTFVVDLIWAIHGAWYKRHFSVANKEFNSVIETFLVLDIVSAVFLISVLALPHKKFSYKFKAVTCMLLCIARSIVDYRVSWNFYFPPKY